MKQLQLLIVALFAFTFSAQAALTPYQWTDYVGKISNTNISLSVYLGEKGKLTGNYCYAKYDKRISLVGEVNGTNVILYEMQHGQQSAFFKGTLLSDSTDHLQGTWSDGKTTLPFNVHLTSIGSGTPTKRYRDTKQSDAAVEAYMKKVKMAILEGNATWLSTQVNYPYKVTGADGKTKNLKTKAEFMANYKYVVSESLKKRIADICTCNLFSNYRGIMLGNGEVWINERPGGKGLWVITGLMP
ncbi:MAG: hypothetical protein FGM54_01315 [Chitinophagaceae bacterium]|nr:hypothetical protein [Chitinophagaceae bacterium]